MPHQPRISSQHILVTGGAGYIGSSLVRELLSQGHRVRVLDSLLYGVEPIQEYLKNPNLELVVDDFRREIAVASALDGVDGVIHMGAIVGDPACALDEDFAIQTNLEATQLISRLAKQRGIQRFIFASTCSVYGASDGELDEQSALHPVSLYANTKIASEQEILSAAGDGFEPVVLRFATVYGASNRPRFDLVVNLLTAKAVTEGRITIHGGDQWRPFVHVEDIVQAITLAYDAPSQVVAGEIFNVGSTRENYKLSDIGTIIQELIPDAQVVTNEQIVDRRNYYVNFDKLRDRLGFEARFTVRLGVEEMRDRLKLGLIGDYHNPRFNNFRYLSETVPERRQLVGAGD